jgi:hypothetical protein
MIRKRGSSNPQYGKSLGQEPLFMKIGQRRNQFSIGKIA